MKLILVFIISKFKSTVDYFDYTFNLKKKRHQVIEDFVSENELKCSSALQSVQKESSKYYLKMKKMNTLFILTTLFNQPKIFDKYISKMNLSAINQLEKYKNEGAIFLSYHMGPFTILPVILVYYGFNVTLLLRSDDATSQSKISFDKIKEKIDTFCGQNKTFGKLRLVDSFSILALIQIQKAIKKKNIVLIYADTIKDSSVQSLPVPFFNQKIVGHLGLIHLFKGTKKQFVPINLCWSEKQINLQVHPILNMDIKNSDQENLNQIYKLFPNLVKRHPEQWTQVGSYHDLKYEE